MKVKKFRYFVGDFETTVYPGQVHTEVWASASVELFSDDVRIFHSIKDQFDYFISLKTNIIVYYHNLKFDGSFWLPFLLVDMGYQQAYQEVKKEPYTVQWLQDKYMKNNTFKYSISNKGMWYNIIIKVGGYFIELRDSLKLLPFSVKKIGENFGTAHKKLDMEYTGLRYAGCTITPEEMKYIENDVLVVKEALEIMFNEGHNKLTIGSCCLGEYKHLTGKEEYESIHPDVYDIWIDSKVHRYNNAGDWILKSYRGGWCYLVKGKEGKVFHNGTTADVNSLYPSVMSSESGNRYPIGKPKFWTGNNIPLEAIGWNKYYFVRIRTRFYLKEGKLPFIQIKGNMMYKSTESLHTSDIWNKSAKRYERYYIDENGEKQPALVELTLTMIDYQLIKEHYYLDECEILDGCWFYSALGIFDEYIEKYKKQKLESKGARRELAKLFLNNLYGKMASSKDSSFKIAYLREDKTIGYIPIVEKGKKPGYIPIGSAITSYARNFTIRAAQKNYHGLDEPGFIYADTDSIHCDLPPDKIQGITVHDKNFCCWKLESCWDVAYFTRQKTYIEHVTHEDCVPVEQLLDKNGNPRKPYYNIKCAGMPQKCKDLFEKSMSGYEIQETDNFTEEEQEFINHRYKITDFNVGLNVPGKLRPINIRGGVILVDTPYVMR